MASKKYGRTATPWLRPHASCEFQANEEDLGLVPIYSVCSQFSLDSSKSTHQFSFVLPFTMNFSSDYNYSNHINSNPAGAENLTSLFHAYFPRDHPEPSVVSSSRQHSHVPLEEPEDPVAATPNVVFLEKPRKSLTAYNFFFKDKREQILQEQKDAGVADKIGFSGMAKAVSKEWKKIDPELKAHYDEMAARDKARYSKELTKWRSMKKAALNGENPAKQTSTSSRTSGMLPRKNKEPVPMPFGPSDTMMMNNSNMNSLQALQTSHHMNDIMAPRRRVSTISVDEGFGAPQGMNMFDNLSQTPTVSQDESYNDVPMFVNIRQGDNNNNNSASTEPVPLLEQNQHDCDQSIMRLMNEHNPSSSLDGLAQTMGPECHDMFLSLFRN